MNPVVAGAIAGVAAALQLLTGEELLAMTLLVAAIGVAMLALLNRDHVRLLQPTAVKAAGAAMVSFAIIAGVPLGFQFFGPQTVSGDFQQPDVYVSDVLAFALPSNLIHFTGNTTENGAYIGLPLLVLFAAGLIVGRKQRWIRWTGWMTLVVAVLSLGPHLHVNGNVTPVWLPWALVAKLPLMGSALPARLMIIGWLGVALVVAAVFAVAINGPRRWRIATGAVLFAGLAVIFPSVPYPSVSASVPAFFRPGGGVENVEPGSVMLITPFSSKEPLPDAGRRRLHARAIPRAAPVIPGKDARWDGRESTACGGDPGRELDGILRTPPASGHDHRGRTIPWARRDRCVLDRRHRTAEGGRGRLPMDAAYAVLT